MSHRFAALLVATAAVATLAGPAAGPAHAAKRLPDLATGTSEPSGTVGGARSRWRLAGRQLTITLPGALVAGGRYIGTVTVTARCGEITSIPGRSEDVFPWATVTRGNARVRASTRTVRVVLTRDLAARTNFCTLTPRAASPAWGRRWTSAAARGAAACPARASASSTRATRSA